MNRHALITPFAAVALCLATLAPLSVLRAEVPGLAALKERQEKIKSVYQKVSPAVVAITSEKTGVAGSGVILEADGLVLTAGHVLAAAGQEFEITLSDGRRLKAKSLGKNMSRDAALARITDKGVFPHVEMADPASVKEGSWCLAMGHPGGMEIDRTAPLRLGRILESEDENGFLVSDCTLSGGDSGGPLFDLDGKLIGIHSSIGWKLAENRHVPMKAFKDSWDRMMKGETWGRLGMPEGKKNPFRPRAEGKEESTVPAVNPETPRLGLVVQANADGGAEVRAVAPGSPADKAGILSGDVIFRVNKEPVTSHEELVGLISNMKAGDKVSVELNRNGEKKTLEATLVKAKEIKD